MIASEYGYTFDEFKKMTYRTLFAAVEMIGIRNHNKYAREAALQGIKLDVKNVNRTFEPLEDAAKKQMIDVHQKAIAKKVEEKRKKNGRKK